MKRSDKFLGLLLITLLTLMSEVLKNVLCRISYFFLVMVSIKNSCPKKVRFYIQFGTERLTSIFSDILKVVKYKVINRTNKILAYSTDCVQILSHFKEFS